jgi:hypothetical protein
VFSPINIRVFWASRLFSTESAGFCLSPPAASTVSAKKQVARLVQEIRGDLVVVRLIQLQAEITPKEQLCCALARSMLVFSFLTHGFVRYVRFA